MKRGRVIIREDQLIINNKNIIHDQNWEEPNVPDITQNEIDKQDCQDHLIKKIDLRTRREKRSEMTFITESEFRNAYEALCFANSLGILMNTELTINYRKFGEFTDSEIEQISNKFWQCYLKRDSTQSVENAKSADDLAARRFEYRRFPYINVFERDSSGSLHSHSILAVSTYDKDRFTSWVNNYFAKAFGSQSLLDGTIKLNVSESDEPARQWFWFSYMFKTTDPSIKWLKNISNFD